MQNEPLTPRDLYEMVDYYRGMRMNLDRDGGGNVWRYKHARNIIHIQSNNWKTAVFILPFTPKISKRNRRRPQFRLSGTKMDIARRLDFELAVLNLED